MRPSRLIIEGWCAYRQRVVLDLPAGPIGVVAHYAENPRRSNMGGKSALLEAVTWCLYGIHRKRLDDQVVYAGAQLAMVVVEFDTGLVVTRTKQRGKPVRLVVRNEATGLVCSDEQAQAVVIAALGMGAEDYRATVGVEQRDVASLVTRTSGERREIVAGWLRLDRWARAGMIAAGHARKAALEVERSSARIAGFREGIADDAPMETDVRLRLQRELVSAVEKSEEHATKLKELRAVRADAERAEELRRLGEEYARLKAEVAATGDAWEKMRALDAKHAELLAAEGAARAENIAAGAAVAHFDGFCPVTCGECPAAEHVRADVVGRQSRATSARLALQAAGAAVTPVSRARDIEGERLETNRRDVARLKVIAERAWEIKPAAERAGTQSVAGIDASIAGEEAQVATILPFIEEARRRLATDDERLRVAQEREERLMSLETEHRGYVAISRVASLAARALGPSGVSAALARAMLGDLEARANALLADVPLHVSFGWERETRDPSKVCLECGHGFVGKAEKSCPGCGAARGPGRRAELDILIDDGSGEVEDVSEKSGGCQALVGVVLRLAGGMMLREQRDAACSFALVDEPFGALDEEIGAQLARMFTSLLAGVGLDQALVVSHDQRLLAALPHRIVITRDGNESTARVE